MAGTTAWNVYHNGRKIDMVFYDADCTADYVKRGLIGHDGYPSDITIRRNRAYSTADWSTGAAPKPMIGAA